jgi:hypothetical protein
MLASITVTRSSETPENNSQYRPFSTFCVGHYFCLSFIGLFYSFVTFISLSFPLHFALSSIPILSPFLFMLCAVLCFAYSFLLLFCALFRFFSLVKDSEVVMITRACNAITQLSANETSLPRRSCFYAV